MDAIVHAVLAGRLLSIDDIDSDNDVILLLLLDVLANCICEEAASVAMCQSLDVISVWSRTITESSWGYGKEKGWGKRKE
jgi:hypothetical protein